MLIAIIFLVAFVLTIGFATHDDGIASAVTGTIALLAFGTLAFMGITSQHTADMDTRAATCGVMWEGIYDTNEAIAHIADVCNIDDTRATRVYADAVGMDVANIAR